MIIYLTSCNQYRSANDGITSYQSATDTELAEFIGKIKAVDNHTHVNTINPDDTGSDALPLDLLLPFDIPARLRPESPGIMNLYFLLGKKLNETTGDNQKQILSK